MRARHVAALFALGALIASCGNQDQAPQPAPAKPEEKVAVSVNELGSSITLNASSAGAVRRYKPAGCTATYQLVTNYEVGGGPVDSSCSNYQETFRAYFTFNLSGIQHASVTTPTSATLSATNVTSGSTPQTVNFTSFSATPAADLTTFGNLAGTAYGTVNVTAANTPNPLTIALNATGLADVKAKLGSGSITIGATYSSESTTNIYALNSTTTPTLALVLTCDAGYADCNGGTDGCETNITTSATNCGACGTVCSSSNIATPTCASSVCNGTCNSGYLDCDGDKQSNGCEKANSDSSCGCSNTTCTQSQTCNLTTGVCGACAANTMDCDTSAANGCEKVLNTDASCGTTCSAGACAANQTCSSNACTNCAAGTLDCDATPVVCEKAIYTNANCGTTCSNGVACGAAQTCSSGACTACAAGTQDCDATPGVCEKTNSRTDCGCGHAVCGATETCSSGVCVACGANTLDCNATSADGCETATNTTTSCGTTCTGGATPVHSCDDSNACTVDSCSSGVCSNVAGNAGGTCRAVAGTCDVAEVCPTPKYEKTITIAGSQVTAALTNFAVLVRTTDADLKARAASNGSDIYFTSNHTTVLDYEIERYDSSTGTLVAWVRIPSVASGSNTTFYMSYGGGGSDQSNPTGVWDSNSKYVWHMAQDPGPGGAGDIKDSTTHANGTAIASMTSSDLVDAVAGKGINFNGTSSQISFTNTFTGTSTSTLSAWVNQATDTDGISDTIISFGNSANPQHRFLYSQSSASNNIYYGFYTPSDQDSGTTIENLGWKHVAWTWDGSNSRIYVDGTLKSTMAHTGANTSGSAGLIGNATFAGRWLRGLLDEVRVDTTTRSVDWIAAEYNNQKSGSTFISISSENASTTGCPADTFVASGTVCRALVASPSCDIAAETCTGSSAACPADTVKTAGTSCRASAGVCDAAETCDGTNPTCPSDSFLPNTTVCRAIASACDLVAETCTGSGAACPADAGFASNATVCRASAGTCDVDEKCTGSSGACPADAFVSSSTVCRSSAGTCDPAENCTGSAAACPADALSPSTTTCRGAVGACDIAENCTGSSVNCPTDFLVSSGTVCRAIASSCDLVAETCTGSSGTCPADAMFATAGTTCRAASGVCDTAETCSGSSGSCPADGFAASGTTCRASAGACDVAESCSGSSTTCPADSFVSSATVCRAVAGVCDVAENCTGSTAACPADAFLPNTTVCGTRGGNICDAVDLCSGSSATCTNAYAPVGSDCAYGTGATTVWAAGAPVNTSDITTGDWSTVTASELAAASAPGSWNSNVLKFVTTSNSTANANRYIYQKGVNSSYTPASTDYLEYDVYLDDNAGAIGGLDVKDTGSYWRDLGVVDQNTIGFHPASDISARAYQTWYHRRFAVPRTVQLSYVDVVTERDPASTTSTAYFDNIVFTKKKGACDGSGVCRLKDGVTCSVNSDCASGTCSGGSCLSPQGNGAACTANNQCVSGFCVDSKCCASACGGGVATDCQACDVSGHVGSCWPSPSGTVCRTSQGTCDVSEACDGSSTACPIDTQ